MKREIFQLRADVELIKAKLGMLDCQQPNSGNRSEIPNSSEPDYTYLLPAGYEFCQEQDAEKWVKVEVDNKYSISHQLKVGEFAMENIFVGTWKPIRKIQEQPAPGDWSTAPEWANWKAMDKCGRWYWYESMPTLGDSIWRQAGIGQIIIGQTATDKDWTQTLEQRPNQLFQIAIHEAISTEPDPYEVDWSKAPEWAAVHCYDGDGSGYWYGTKAAKFDTIWEARYTSSGYTLLKGLDWKQSKRRRPQ